MNTKLCCHVCNTDDIREIKTTQNFSQVTSDCKPWNSKLELAVCQQCGVVQKNINDNWKKETEKIYSEYEVYAQGAGNEQLIFDSVAGYAVPRSERIVQWLSKEIGLPKTGTLIDIGCGNNPFKEKIGILIGIDPAFGQADYQTTLEDFQTDQLFDVAFCLGSINFGTEEIILKQIQLVINFLKPTARIYWRCNPGLKDHGNKECEAIDFFPWTKQLHKKYAEQFGFELADIQDDTNNRIYAEWRRA